MRLSLSVTQGGAWIAAAPLGRLRRRNGAGGGRHAEASTEAARQARGASLARRSCSATSHSNKYLNTTSLEEMAQASAAMQKQARKQRDRIEELRLQEEAAAQQPVV